MTETNANIHVLADETLGGIKREYVEVDREAEVGEKIVIVNANVQCEAPYSNGDVFEAESLLGYSSGIQTTCHRDIFDFEYHVLEPTDIVHIDGPDGTQRYELTDRKAEVGDKILTTQTQLGRLPVGKVLTVTDVFDDDSVGEWGVGIVVKTNYRVLVPVEVEADEPQPADLIDVVSNLATKVANLERTIKRYKDEIDTLHKDNRTLGEELEKARKDLRETMDDVSCMDEEIKRAGSDINEMSFAVEDLAEALKNTDPVYGERIFTAEEVVAVMTALKVRP
ncbi:hypothetical protein [Bacillus atrophaeus]|uniref:hypothetical protein n=1 Tax=Bacillus atrophaeus TaxID=1452 RepID=UPI00359C22B2